MITTMLNLVLFLTKTVSGKTHDKKISDENYRIPEGFELWQDTGYQGYRPEGVKIVQPMKKPKGKELTREQKGENKRISSVRVRVEHAIGSIKRLRIVKDECRLRRGGFVDSVMKTAAGLHNLRLIYRPFHYS